LASLFDRATRKQTTFAANFAEIECGSKSRHVFCYADAISFNEMYFAVPPGSTVSFNIKLVSSMKEAEAKASAHLG
jgi:hypothetical protein